MEIKPSMQKDVKKAQMHVTRTLEPVEGWLKKKSPHMVQGWQARFCKLMDKKFYYYKKKDLENPVGVLDFDIVSVVLTEMKESGALKGFMYKS